MTLRITRREQLEQLGTSVRRQFERLWPEKAPHIHPQPGAEPQISTPTPRGRRDRPEQEAGRALIQWADETPLPARHVPAAERPRVPMIGEYLVHTPNGGWRGSAVEAAILQGQGVRKSWPDYTLYIPVGRWHGLVLELKAEDGDKPEVGQLIVLERLECMGYAARVAWGAAEAKDAIWRYLAEPSGERR